MILLFCCILLIYLVSYENTLISIQQHCALRGNFLILVFYIWSLLVSLPSISARVEFFRFPREKRSLVRNTSVVSFLCIPYSPPFRTVLHSSLLSLGVISLLHVCIIEIIFNHLIYLFVWELAVAFSITHFFSFISKKSKNVHKNSETLFNGSLHSSRKKFPLPNDTTTPFHSECVSWSLLMPRKSRCWWSLQCTYQCFG